MIQVDEDQEQQRPGDAIAELRAAGMRLRDAGLDGVIRRVRWQIAHLEKRVVDAEGTSRKATARAENLIRQRDRALAECRDMPARIERQGTELRRAIAQAKDAVAERNEARAAWETVKVENQKLRSEIGTLKNAKPAPAAEAPKATKLKQPAIFDTLPPVEPSAEEAVMMAARAQVVAEVDRLTAIGKHRNPAQQAQMVALQRQLAEYSPKVKAFKAARHARRMQLEAEVLAREALAAAGLV